MRHNGCPMRLNALPMRLNGSAMRLGVLPEKRGQTPPAPMLRPYAVGLPPLYIRLISTRATSSAIGRISGLCMGRPHQSLQIPARRAWWGEASPPSRPCRFSSPLPYSMPARRGRLAPPWGLAIQSGGHPKSKRKEGGCTNRRCALHHLGDGLLVFGLFRFPWHRRAPRKRSFILFHHFARPTSALFPSSGISEGANWAFGAPCIRRSACPAKAGDSVGACSLPD